MVINSNALMAKRALLQPDSTGEGGLPHAGVHLASFQSLPFIQGGA
ncbi:hypothetical protein KNP414_05622 [Paenibacillus mucilaginosus KNP414]|uniref:Uncharacterized protein n=1 Tax=Paenibacillus mucilaginosus (strain KNP414) TaxID=1036673 RepID=F8FLL9_PAEMK|nr:hypothetical protein KNP414_05622 [Paenibacillus mucilaginosus KNP414]